MFGCLYVAKTGTGISLSAAGQALTARFNRGRRVCCEGGRFYFRQTDFFVTGFLRRAADPGELRRVERSQRSRVAAARQV